MEDISIMIGSVKFNYRAGLMVEKDGQILVECNPEFDFVTLPGGRVQALESSADALKREINEEMGIDLGEYEPKLKALIENFFEMRKQYHELYFLYKIKIKSNDKNFVSGMKNKDSKASYYKWVNKDELDKVNLLPDVLRTLTDTDEFEHIAINSLQKQKKK